MIIAPKSFSEHLFSLVFVTALSFAIIKAVAGQSVSKSAPLVATSVPGASVFAVFVVILLVSLALFVRLSTDSAQKKTEGISERAIERSIVRY